MLARDIYCAFNHVDRIDRQKAVPFPDEEPGYVNRDLFKYMVRLSHPEIGKPLYFAWLGEKGNFLDSDYKRDDFLKDMAGRCFAAQTGNPDEDAYNRDILGKIRQAFGSEHDFREMLENGLEGPGWAVAETGPDSAALLSYTDGRLTGMAPLMSCNVIDGHVRGILEKLKEACESGDMDAFRKAEREIAFRSEAEAMPQREYVATHPGAFRITESDLDEGERTAFRPC